MPRETVMQIDDFVALVDMVRASLEEFGALRGYADQLTETRFNCPGKRITVLTEPGRFLASEVDSGKSYFCISFTVENGIIKGLLEASLNRCEENLERHEIPFPSGLQAINSHNARNWAAWEAVVLREAGRHGYESIQ